MLTMLTVAQPKPTTADSADCGQEYIKYKRLSLSFYSVRNQHCSQHFSRRGCGEKGPVQLEAVGSDTTDKPQFHPRERINL